MFGICRHTRISFACYAGCGTKCYGTGDILTCQLRVASCQLRVASCELSVDICQLRVDICQLRVDICQLSVAS